MKNVFVTVRSSSTRLPNKCFLKFGKLNVLEHVIERAIFYDLLPIICTTKNKDDDKIEELAFKNKYKIFRGASNNKILRWLNCCDEFNIDYFHTVDADDPFFCGEEVSRSLKLLEQKGLDVVEPSTSSSEGGATVGFSLRKNILKKAILNLDHDHDTEMISGFINRVKDIKVQKLKEAEDFVIRQRLTLDYWEDYLFLSAIRMILGKYPTRKEIYELLENNPDLEKINSFRNFDWKIKQNTQIKNNNLK
tara:strand:- start:15 stop:761 length:747 start_codon:yes stop_codon:yes gene_type:complete